MKVVVVEVTCNQCGAVRLSSGHRELQHGFNELEDEGYTFDYNGDWDEYAGDGHNEPAVFQVHGVCPKCNGLADEPVQLKLF